MCLTSLKDDHFDDYMLFFGQIEEICIFLNNSVPAMTTEAIKKVAFSLNCSFIIDCFRVSPIILIWLGH